MFYTIFGSLWLHILTDIKVSMPLGISAFTHVLKIVRASSIFVERCKCISYSSLQGEGAELDMFCHILLLVAGFHQQ